MEKLGNHLPADAAGWDDAADGAQGTGSVQVDARDNTERERVEAALAQCAGNQTRAAKLLGISRGTLVARLKQFRLPRPRT